MHALLTLLLLLPLMGCVTANQVIAMRDAHRPRIGDLEVCSGFGCDQPRRVALSSAEWDRIALAFAPPAEDAAAERARIAAAIAAFEHIVGPKAGTAGDRAESAVFMWDASGQLDCIDETLNTNAYLRLLAGAGLLRFHEVGRPAHRGYVVDLVGPHNTATIAERGSGARYAVDSWFHANGEPPEIVAIERWLRNWKPAKTAHSDGGR